MDKQMEKLIYLSVLGAVVLFVANKIIVNTVSAVTPLSLSLQIIAWVAVIYFMAKRVVGKKTLDYKTGALSGAIVFGVYYVIEIIYIYMNGLATQVPNMSPLGPLSALPSIVIYIVVGAAGGLLATLIDKIIKYAKEK